MAGLEDIVFSLIACAGFLQVSRVTSLFKAETTSGSFLTQAVERAPNFAISGFSFISTAYWWPNSCSARVRLNLSTIPWSLWISVRPRRMGVLLFSMVFFDGLFANPSNPSDKAGDGCGVEERFNELVVRHGVCVCSILRV